MKNERRCGRPGRMNDMKLMIVRHGDPDYSIDSLTPTGWEEARLLACRLAKLDVKAFYVSPLGRARDTAAPTLTMLGRTAQVLPWLEEFPARIRKPGQTHDSVAWDWLPEEWTKEPDFYDKDRWCQVGVLRNAGVPELAQQVYQGLDALLARHGYVREGGFYRAVQPNEDTVVLFCHFGLECLLLGHLLQVSPMTLWHGACAAPTSVTTLVTEERREGIACFRMGAFGDTSHLYAAGREPSFSARFCETFTNWEQRHD